MALLNIRQLGDEVLSKKCKPIRVITPRIKQLAEDMFETMYDAGGVGLAAPQVGILKQIVVIDTTPDVDPDEELDEEIVSEKFVMINPKILATEGEQTGYEGCLSYENMCGLVTRPMKVKVQYTDLSGDEYEMEVEGFLARAVCHELDHLDGIMYTSKVQGKIYTNEELAKLREESEKAEE